MHAADPAFEPETQALYDELCADVRLACTSGMLLALTREARLAYVLGDVVGLSAPEAAEVLGTTPAAFRQRLSRARAVMRELMGQRCGLVREDDPCRCDRLVTASEERGLLDRSRPAFARHPGVALLDRALSPRRGSRHEPLTCGALDPDGPHGRLDDGRAPPEARRRDEAGGRRRGRVG